MYEFLAGALGVLGAGLLWYFKKGKGHDPAVLEEIENRKEELNDQLEAIEEEEKKLEEDGVKDLSPDEVVEFWNGRLDDKEGGE